MLDKVFSISVILALMVLSKLPVTFWVTLVKFDLSDSISLIDSSNLRFNNLSRSCATPRAASLANKSLRSCDTCDSKYALASITCDLAWSTTWDASFLALVTAPTASDTTLGSNPWCATNCWTVWWTCLASWNCWVVSWTFHCLLSWTCSSLVKLKLCWGMVSTNPKEPGWELRSGPSVELGAGPELGFGSNTSIPIGSGFWELCDIISLQDNLLLPNSLEQGLGKPALCAGEEPLEGEFFNFNDPFLGALGVEWEDDDDSRLLFPVDSTPPTKPSTEELKFKLSGLPELDDCIRTPETRKRVLNNH